jgi:hypothetical protein
MSPGRSDSIQKQQIVGDMRGSNRLAQVCSSRYERVAQQFCQQPAQRYVRHGPRLSG